MDTRTKIVSLPQAEASLHSTQPGRRPAVVKGRFAVLQAEYCRRLAKARKQGPPLVVLVFADDKTRRAPLDQTARAELVASLVMVDYVIICDEAEADELASSLNPKVVLDAEEPPPRNIIADVLQRQSSI